MQFNRWSVDGALLIRICITLCDVSDSPSCPAVQLQENKHVAFLFFFFWGGEEFTSQKENTPLTVSAAAAAALPLLYLTHRTPL